ncbi:hypothetical protein KCU77_g14747, partial [Aureobasidium melanogenum]
LCLYHPHGVQDDEYAAIFTDDKPIIFNFHSYPYKSIEVTYKCKGQHLLRARGYKEKGNLDTPLELAIRNKTDRYNLTHFCLAV